MFISEDVITSLYLRLVIEQSKTDVYRQGQLVTLPLSSDPFSAYSLLISLIDALITLWKNSSPTGHLQLAPTLCFFV